MDSVSLWTILYGFGGGTLAYLVFQGILSIKTFRMQSAIVALQRQFLSLRTQSYVNKRWDKRDALEEEIKSLAQKPTRTRYDNDPLEVNPQEWR